MTSTPTPEALDFLEQHGTWVGLKRVGGVAKLLDRFAAAKVERERERCVWLAGDECRSRSDLLDGIKNGEQP